MTDDASDAVSAADAAPPGILTHGGQGVAVRAPASGFVIPSECACCGAPPERSAEERHFSGRAVLVPYCAECHRHMSREATRRLAVSLSVAILALTLGAGLPLVWQPHSALAYAVAVLGAGLLPVVFGLLWPKRLLLGHGAASGAAIFRLDGALACARPEWGERVALASGATSFGVRFRERRAPVRTIVALVVFAAVLPAYYRVHFPTVRVVNLTDARLEIAVDDRVRASVPPTSAESTGAGVEIRVPAGRRLFTARDETGRVVDTATVSVETGGQHLYAPASDAYCFWVEVTGYGKSRDAGTRLEPLSGSPRFWALGDAVDLWFSPTPDADFDDRSTGGFLRAIRQARCDAAPGSMRRATEK